MVQRADDGVVVRSPEDVTAGDGLRVRVARGELAAQVVRAATAAEHEPTALTSPSGEPGTTTPTPATARRR